MKTHHIDHPIRNPFKAHPRPHLVEVLALLLEEGFVSSTTELAQIAERRGETDAATSLRSMAAERLPPWLAMEKLQVELAEAAYRRQRGLLERGGRIGLLLPLPPHVLDDFLAAEDAVLLAPDGHHVPPHLRGRPETRLGSRPCRDEAGALDVVVFEAHRQSRGLAVAPEVTDIVDPRLLRPGASLVVHLRPHPHPRDEDLPAAIAARVAVL